MLRRCESQANKRTGEKGKKKTAVIRLHSATAARVHLEQPPLSAVQVYLLLDTLHQKKEEKIASYSSSVSSPSIHLSPSPLALMIHSLSINQFFKLSNYPSPPPPSISLRSWIYKSEVPQVLNNQFCHFPSVCLKARRWTSLVKQTRVNNSHLNWQGQKSSEVARDENQKVNAEASASSHFGVPSDRWQKLLLRLLSISYHLLQYVERGFIFYISAASISINECSPLYFLPNQKDKTCMDICQSNYKIEEP